MLMAALASSSTALLARTVYKSSEAVRSDWGYWCHNASDTIGKSRAQEGKDKQSILDLQSVDITAEGKGVRWRYMDRFPFRWYLVVRDVVELPGVLATALRQWFAEVVDASG